MKFPYRCTNCGSIAVLRAFDPEDPSESRYRYCIDCGNYTDHELMG